MKTRWSTVLAALCLTLMALGSSRAAHAESVKGAGTVVSPVFGVIRFSVSAANLEGGHISVSYDVDHVHYDVTGVRGILWGRIFVTGVVTHALNPNAFPVGRADTFLFQDGSYPETDGIDRFAWTGLDSVLTLRPLTTGQILIRH
jgi:hypothetical protein